MACFVRLTTVEGHIALINLDLAQAIHDDLGEGVLITFPNEEVYVKESLNQIYAHYEAQRNQ